MYALNELCLQQKERKEKKNVNAEEEKMRAKWTSRLEWKLMPDAARMRCWLFVCVSG